MKSISIFVADLRGGGAERVMVTLANELANCGYRVDLLLLNAEGPYLSEVSNRVEIVELKANRAIYSIFKIARYLRVKQPNAVLATQSHINLVLLLAKIIAIIVTMISKKPLKDSSLINFKNELTILTFFSFL